MSLPRDAALSPRMCEATTKWPSGTDVTCRLSRGHAGPHEGESEDAYLARVMPDPVPKVFPEGSAAFVKAGTVPKLAATAAPAKPRYVLIPPLALRAVARVLTHGATVHEDYSWRTRLAEPGGQAVFVDKALRHLEEHRCGRRKDEDSGESPLACAIANLLFLLEREEEEAD